MRSRRFLAAAVLVVAGWSAATGVAMAHDLLVSASPADGQSVATSPEKIELEFSGGIQSLGDGPALAVTDSGGNVMTGDLEVEGSTVRFFLGSVLPDDEYHVDYRIVSTDGHVVTGSTRFFVGPMPARGAPFGTDEPAEDGRSNVPVVVLGMVGAIVAIAVALLVLRRLRREQPPR